ncbi:DUF4391 domain-containing protein [Ruminococcus sp.]|uniref:DUF4391 domain-containing protein n=1 Tax=Ruminococcus sp. TaxID=41978 RepID=UPI0025E98B49|nr:DUF4391 domain-containing protein [Ruminococcus sp.]MBR1431831.1 DUF4391 domain-containing protein [Ruminococcus sp.]
MFGLPDSTYFGKLVPKNKFYDKLTIDKKLERSFIDQINSIRWAHKLSADTLNVEKGGIVEEVEVFLIKLKTSELDLNVLRQMDKELHYHLIFILEYDGQYQLWTAYKEESTNTAFKVGNYYHTDWVTEDTFSLRIDGLNMDTVYENLVRQIAGDTLAQENSESLKETVERQAAREKLTKDIEKLRAKIRKEKQFNRQVELNKQLKALLKQLEEL